MGYNAIRELFLHFLYGYGRKCMPGYVSSESNALRIHANTETPAQRILTMAKNTATVAEVATIATVEPGNQATVGSYTIANRGTLPVTVSTGGKNGYRFKINGITVTGVMRWCGFNGWGWDDMRCVLSLLGLGEAVNDNTVGCQISSGRQSAVNKGKASHHGVVPSDDEMGKETIAELKAMKAATAEVAAKGRELRRAGTEVAKMVTGTGKARKVEPVAFNWRSGFATQFVASEAGTVKRKSTPRKKK